MTKKQLIPIVLCLFKNKILNENDLIQYIMSQKNTTLQKVITTEKQLAKDFKKYYKNAKKEIHTRATEKLNILEAQKMDTCFNEMNIKSDSGAFITFEISEQQIWENVLV